MSDHDLEVGDTVIFEGQRATVTREYDGTNMDIDREEDGPITVMPSHVTPIEDVPTDFVDGVGGSRAESLEGIGIHTVGDLVEADVEDLTEAGISEGHAEEVHDNAVSLLE